MNANEENGVPPASEVEELRRQLAAMTHERDVYKKCYLSELARNAVEPTEEELAGAIPLRPWLDDILRRLEVE